MYITKYDGGGQLWPIAHTTTIFSLLVAQVIAIGVFRLKDSTAASGFIVPLLIGTFLFNQYCRQRFLPVFKNNAAQVRSLTRNKSPSTPFFLIIIFQIKRVSVLGSY